MEELATRPIAKPFQQLFLNDEEDDQCKEFAFMESDRLAYLRKELEELEERAKARKNTLLKGMILRSCFAS